MIIESANQTCKYDKTFFSTWTPSSAYLLGYLEADGTFLLYKDTLRVQFCTSSKDKEYLSLLKDLVKFDGKISIREHLVKGNIYSSYGFTVSSKQWKHDLEDKHRIGKIPECINKDLLPHYIRGYFDGDGSIYFSKQANNLRSGLVSSSEEFLEDLVKRLEKVFGKRHNIYLKTSSKHCWYIGLGNKDTKTLMNFIYQAPNSINLKRKYTRARSLLST